MNNADAVGTGAMTESITIYRCQAARMPQGARDDRTPAGGLRVDHPRADVLQQTLEFG